MVMVGVDPDPANADACAAWTSDYHEALHPYSAGGAYVNMMMEEGQDRVEASTARTTSGWRKIKAEVRPGQLLPRQPEHPTRKLREGEGSWAGT